ncbi:MAG: septum formation initiator family protein [Leptospiraceae bacterium]|nr:septum formation initiator family protein [Leptospiraceae bacterium]MDW8307308.1 septum formation initiator family protein [Leptospiraceae bacterium]
MYELRYLLRQFLNHWLFWPLVSLLMVIALYIFFFTENGFFAYREALAEKARLEKRIGEMQQQKEELLQKLSLLRDDERALKNLSREFLIFPEKVSLIKFREKKDDLSDKEAKTKSEEEPSYLFWRKVYVALTTLLLLFIAYRSFKRHEGPPYP